MDSKVRKLTILLPVNNEIDLIETAFHQLKNFLQENKINYEIIFCENGSKDSTFAKCKELAAVYGNIKVITIPKPNYGRAVKEGIFASSGDCIICFDIDHLDFDFMKESLSLLERYDVIIGSKLLRESKYIGPWLRKFSSRFYNSLLKVFVNFKGTDTHGIKTYKSALIRVIAKQCLTEHSLFVSELLIRAALNGYKIREIPVTIFVENKRMNYWKMARRFPRVAVDMLVLIFFIGLAKRKIF